MCVVNHVSCHTTCGNIIKSFTYECNNDNEKMQMLLMHWLVDLLDGQHLNFGMLKRVYNFFIKLIFQMHIKIDVNTN